MPEPTRLTVSAVLRYFPVLLLAIAFLSGCDEPPQKKKATLPAVKLRVVTTTTQAADLARRIGGPAFEVVHVFPAGKNPWTYAPTARERASMMTADLVVINGLGLEAMLGETPESLGAGGAKVVDLGAAVPPELLIYPEGKNGPPDPCIWMDPTVWSHCTVPLENAMAELWPGTAERTHTVAHTLRQDLKRDADWAKDLMQRVHPQSRFVLSTRPTLAYLSRFLELEYATLFNREGTATQEQIDAFGKLAAERGTANLFPETSEDMANLRIIATAQHLKIGKPIFTMTLEADGSEIQGSVDRYKGDTVSGTWRMTVEAIQRSLIGL